MNIGGLSTSLKFFFKKLSEDLIIIKSYFKLKFIFIYIKKLHVKISGYLLQK